MLLYCLDTISDRQTLSQSIVAALEGGQSGEVVRDAGTDRPKMLPRSWQGYVFIRPHLWRESPLRSAVMAVV